MGKVKVAQLDYLFTFYLTLPRPRGDSMENIGLNPMLERTWREVGLILTPEAKGGESSLHTNTLG